jgi:hypothetical protein
MAYGSVLTDVVQSSVTGSPPQFNDGAGTQTGTLCRVWVNFNGSTSSIRASFNVGSITKNATGDFTVNFTNALSDANYSATGSMNTNNAGANAFYPNVYSTSSFRFYTTVPTTGVVDPTILSVAIFR